MDNDLKIETKVKTKAKGVEVIEVAVDRRLKKKYQKILDYYGLSLPESIRLFIGHAVANGDLSYLK